MEHEIDEKKWTSHTSVLSCDTGLCALDRFACLPMATRAIFSLLFLIYANEWLTRVSFEYKQRNKIHSVVNTCARPNSIYIFLLIVSLSSFSFFSLCSIHMYVCINSNFLFYFDCRSNFLLTINDVAFGIWCIV